MAKNKKKLSSDNVRSKKKGAIIKVNPFEVKFNKQKHKVLGKKISKYDKGQPGVSRSRAIQKRKETLLVELKQSGKVNTLMDKRIGENNPDMSVEEKMLQRFAAERKKVQAKSGNKFSLNDEDTLTHYGQSLSEIEKFDEPLSSDDEDDEEKGKIGAKMVAEEHFGGGVLKKADESESAKNKTWKERMEEIIAQSKKEKYQRQHEKEKHKEVTEKLDEEWDEIRTLMSMGKKKETEINGKLKKKIDDYDIAVKELHFEMKGQATDRMKTEEELAAEEKERLEKLEMDRLRRMKGITKEEEEERSKQRKYLSADDLDDGFTLSKNKSYEVKYKDGKMITSENEDSDENDDEIQEDLNDEDDDEDGSSGNDSGSNSESGDDVMAHLSDLESSGEEDDDSEEDGNEDDKTTGKTKTENVAKNKQENDEQKIKDLLMKKKAVMEGARKELPYTFKAPETFEDLLSLLEDHNTVDKVIIIERIRACHHPSLAEGNKAKLETLFQLLLQLYGELLLQQPPDFRLMDMLVIHLYELCRQAPLASSKAVLDIVVEKQQQYQEKLEAKNGKGQFPSFDVLMYFKLISILFPTSDLKHPVVTPAMLFMSRIISQSAVQTTRDVAMGLLVCNLFLEYVSFSKRFVPEVLNFLSGMLFLGIKKNPSKVEPVLPPLKPVGKYIDILKLNSDCANLDIEKKMTFNLNSIFTPHIAFKYLMTDTFRLCCIKMTLSLLSKFSSLYNDLASYREIFKPVCYFCKKLPKKQYPKFLQKHIKDLILEIESKSEKKDRKRLTMTKVKTKALMLFEPKIDEDFDPTRKKHADHGKEKNEKQRLLHKHKKELKGAVREIRKDNQFMAKEKLKDQITRDKERKRKVRELMGSLATQEGEFKAMKRQKNKF